MIISCIKCNKKFAVEDKLIPELGRILQCGSCSHQWHYIPVLVMDKDIPTQKSDDAKKQVDQNTIEENINDQTDQSNFEKNIEVNEPNNFKDEPKNDDINKLEKAPLNKESKKLKKNKKEKNNFLSKLIVIIISIIALVIILDTFRMQLLNIIPNLDLYLDSLYNTLTDIFLFIKNLIK